MVIRSKCFRIATIVCITSGLLIFDSPNTWILKLAMRIVSLPRGGGGCVLVTGFSPGIEMFFQPPVCACCRKNQPTITPITASKSDDERFMAPPWALVSAGAQGDPAFGIG